MSIVVGIAPSHPSDAAVHLGAVLARSYEQPLVLVAVQSAGWPHRGALVGGVDTEYRDFVTAQANDALAYAAELVPDDITLTTLVHDATSARRGLLEACDAHDAMRLVVGAKGTGLDDDSSRTDEIELGSVVTGLLQSAHVPVAIAPHGFAAAPGAKLSRMNAAFSGSAVSGELVLGAAALAAETNCAFRITSFHTRPRAFASAGVGFDAEAPVIREWERVIREHTDELLSEISQFSVQPPTTDVALGAGDSWHEALRAIDWHPVEALLVGSSSLGPLSLVSLGSHAVKIVRHSPVPVVVVPRRATDDYIALAEEASA